ncbi:MAG: Rrf2 family transcriptional regulator [Oscillospiraceae bacterium]|nr:Rrf2 family transcriptional regulator [Oscillospiraceae bacterium]
MTFSTKGRYALRVMIDLAVYSNGDYIALKDIAKRQEISLKYLEQVISLLNKAGFLQSMRGNNGGYKLAKNPKEYTAGDILRATEGSLAPISCLQNTPNQCERRDKCTTISFWEKYYQIVTDYVDNVTLNDLAENVKSMIGNDYNI